MVYCLVQSDRDGLMAGPDARLGSIEYRGTYRCAPPLPGDGCVGQRPLHESLAWFAATETPQLQPLVELRRLLHVGLPERSFEIIGCDHCERPPPEAYGYDVSLAFFHSLVWDLLLDPTRGSAAQATGGQALLLPLARAVLAHFGGRLNAHGLFSCHDEAEWFLDCAKSLSTICDGYWESQEVLADYKVVWVCPV